MLEHSQDLADQQESSRLQRKLAEENPEYAALLKYAEEHLARIERFGRFPPAQRDLGSRLYPAGDRVPPAKHQGLAPGTSKDLVAS